VRALASAGVGFLAAVLWFDLMFDVQARGTRGELPSATRTSIASYYARVTAGARPMNRVVPVAMVAAVAGLAGVIARDELPRWRAVVALALVLVGVGLAGARTVRDAKRLGRQQDDEATQSALARSILRDHLVCLAAMVGALVLLLAPA
jgi:hypothetical protein